MNPLRGQRVLITRAAEDCVAWAERLKDAGAVPVILPCIACETIDEPAAKAQIVAVLPETDWVVFTSRRGVETFSRLVRETERDVLPVEAQVAVVGPATADTALALLGRVDLVAEAGTAESLAQALMYRLEEGMTEDETPASPAQRFLIAVAENAGSVLEDALSSAGGECTRVDLYRTVPAGARSVKQTLSELGADKILLASPTAVTGLLNQIELDTAAEIFTIGPSTSRAARAAALIVTAEATRPSLKGLMETMR